jgi:hypothetical protein
MVIQYNENIFDEIFLDVNPTLNVNVANQELVSILNNINFKNSLKIIEESIPKESFLGNYKNKKFRKGYGGNRKKPQNYPKTRQTTFLNKDNGIDDKIKKDINGNLNKITNSNSDTIFTEIIKIFSENIEIFDYEAFIDCLFDKAVKQPIYCPIYVKLFLKIEKTHNELDFDNQGKFSDLILGKCNEFKDMINDLGDDAVLNPDNYDDFCKKNSEKVFKQGFSQFVGELYRNQFVNRQFLNEYLIALVDNIIINLDKEDTNIENSSICLIQLVNTSMNKRQLLNSEVLPKINKIIKYKIIPKKIKFKFMDLLDEDV